MRFPFPGPPKSTGCFIRATPQAIWDAITNPEWTEQYGYGGRAEYDLRPGGAYRALAPESMLAMGSPAVVVAGEVVEADPPRKLVQTWRPLWDPELVAEGHKRLTWEIADAGEAAGGGGGWSWILSDLKSLLETGKPLAG